MTLSPWCGSPGTRRVTLSPWGDSQPWGQPGSRGAPLTAGVLLVVLFFFLLMEGLTSTGAFPPPRQRAARREELPKNQTWIPKGKNAALTCLGRGKELLHPQGTAGHSLGTQRQPARPKISPLPSLTGEAGLAPRGQAAAGSSPGKNRGVRGWDHHRGVPSLPWVGVLTQVTSSPSEDSLDASAVLEVGQVAADGSETGQDLEGGKGVWGHPLGPPPWCWTQPVSPPGQDTAVAPTWAKGVTIMSSPCLREHRGRE